MKEFLRKLGWLRERSRKEAELREELEFHLAAENRDLRACGLTEQEARRRIAI